MLILKTLTYPYYVFGNEEFASRTSYYFVLYGAFIDRPVYQFDNSLVFRKCQQGLPLPTIQ